MTSSAVTLIVLAQAYLGLALPSGLSVGNFDRPLLRNGTCRLPGYTYTPDIGGHKMHTKANSWQEARKICRDEGGDLAVINSQAEADVIIKIFSKSGPQSNSSEPNSAWIGTLILSFEQAYDWETIYGDTLEQAGFNEWHVPKSNEEEKCGAVFRDGKLNWFDCDKYLGFICEVPYLKPPFSILDRQLYRTNSQELAARGEADSD